MKPEGMILIISAPSGAGKTTLCHKLLQRFPEIKESISFTTRSPRKGECDGVDYHFVSREKFMEMVEGECFAEWAEVHGNLYGTALSTIEEARRNGQDIVLDIDCQGARRLKEQLERCIFVFILPPDMLELRKRLENRSTDSEAVISARIERAIYEIKEARWYDYIIINSSIDQASDELASIVTANSLRTFRKMPEILNRFDFLQ